VGNDAVAESVEQLLETRAMVVHHVGRRLSGGEATRVLHQHARVTGDEEGGE